ncbi:MAG TPA: hypothetical protein PKY58_10570, partial [Syntrophales bacterium]|nr:hypothetical protein [Syntrophales bacterium]HQQ27967.1 hypothetical protein [Syntrophales bacterium]
HRQGARIPTNETYLWYVAGRRDEGQHSIWAFYEAVNGDKLIKRPLQHFFERQWKKLHRQGARIPTNETYLWYVAGRRDEGQHSIWAFYEAVNGDIGP